jgi:hypothetical protein
MPSARARHILAILVCNALAVFFALTAWMAVRGKSFTPDEPGHALDGWFMRFHGDYRVWCNNPPLWEYWIALPGSRDAIDYDPASDQYKQLGATVPTPYWSHRVPLWLMERGRVMSLALAVLLIILIGHWAFELGGLIPSIVAVFLICLDPNFLGHGPLLKNDVACALCFLAAAYAIWKIGRRLTMAWAFGLAILMAAAVLVKFSGLLLLPALVVSLALRAVLPWPWETCKCELKTRAARFGAAGGIILLTLLVTFSAIWASYGFRFNAGPDGLELPVQDVSVSLRAYRVWGTLHRRPTVEEVEAEPAPPITRAILAACDYHLLPQAFLCGLVFTELYDQGAERGYLFGESYFGGKLAYFPLAFLFKEPLAIIAAVGFAVVVPFFRVRHRSSLSLDSWWTIICLAVPSGIYAIAAMTSQMNIGFRHFLPVLPFLYMAISVAAGRAWRWPLARGVILILALGLATETLAAFPDFLAFFNLACAGDRAYFLADSNLDWGQDLPALAAWQRAHPNVTIYLNFFGHDIPQAYGINAIELTGAPIAHPATPAVAAVSQTLLQLHSEDTAGLRSLGISASDAPEEILNHTICIFPVHPPASAAPLPPPP